MKLNTLRKLSFVVIAGLLLGGTGLNVEAKEKPLKSRIFEAVVGKADNKTSAVKVGNKRVTVGAIVGDNQVLTVARKDKEANLIDRYGDFEGRTFMSKVPFKVIKKDQNLSLLETKISLEGNALEIADAEEGPCKVISLYDAKVPETSMARRMYNFHRIHPMYPYERAGIIYDKNKVTCDVKGNWNLPKEIVTRDALGRIKKRAYKQMHNPDIWDYYDDRGSLVVQNGQLVGLIIDSITIMFSEGKKTKQRLDGEMITGQEIKKFLNRNKTSRAVNKRNSKEDKQDIRKLYFKAVVDEEYRFVPVIWEKRIRRNFKKASKALKEQFGIELILTGIEKWDSDDDAKGIGDTMRELKREVYPGNNDFVIGFTGQIYKMFKNGIEYNASGLSEGRYLLMTDFSDHKDTIHEVGHSLDAKHSDNPKSVMCQGSQYSTTKFLDKRNIGAIERNKYRNFRQRR